METSQAVPTNSDVNWMVESSSAAAWLMLFIIAASPHLVGVDKLQNGLHGARVVLLQPQCQQQRPAPAAHKAFPRRGGGNHLSLLSHCARGARVRAVWEDTTHRVEGNAGGGAPPTARRGHGLHQPTRAHLQQRLVAAAQQRLYGERVCLAVVSHVLPAPREAGRRPSQCV
jgi:hypothetical protein